MNLKALFMCSNYFYQKIKDALVEGVSRLEFSKYFYKPSQLLEFDFKECKLNLKKAFTAVNKMKEDLRYSIDFNEYFNSFWEDCSANLFVREKHLLAIVYAKNQLSTYIGQIVNLTTKTNIEEFMKKFAYQNKINYVDNTQESTKEKLTVIDKIGPKMLQLPIQSLNEIHEKKHHFPINENIFKYRPSKEELAGILTSFSNSDSIQPIPKKIIEKSKYKSGAKLVACPSCSKFMRSDKLRKHQDSKRCKKDV